MTPDSTGGAASAALPTPVEALTQVRSLLADRERWTQQHYCEPQHAVWYADPERLHGSEIGEAPYAFCLAGAIEFVGFAQTGGYTVRSCALVEAMKKLVNEALARSPWRGWTYLISFNDSYMVTHAEVLELLDLTIAEEAA